MDNTFIEEILNSSPIAPQVLFPTTHPPYIDLRHKNVEVMKAYTNITNDLRYLLSRMSSVENRTYMLTSYEPFEKYSENILFEFICVMGVLTLCVREYAYYIELEADIDIVKVIGKHNYRKMLRAVYRSTMYQNTEHDLEDSINIETCLNDHYTYFKNRLKHANEENTMVIVEEAIVE